MPVFGQQLPLCLQLRNGVSGLFCQVRVRDASGNDLPGSPASMVDAGAGLYVNTNFTMPAESVIATYAVFLDSGLTIPSPDAGSGIDVFEFEFGPGSPITLALQLMSANASRYCTVRVRDTSGNDLPGSPAIMTNVNGGLYVNTSFLMPDFFIIATYYVFTDPAYSIPSSEEGDGVDIFDFIPLPISLFGEATLVAGPQESLLIGQSLAAILVETPKEAIMKMGPSSAKLIGPMLEANVLEDSCDD